MFAIGPYRFTKVDAEKTLREAVERRSFDRARLTGDLEADLHAVWDAWGELRQQRPLPRTQPGRVVGLHVSNGGLPKLAVEEFAVGWSGADGDRQASRNHHGRPWQALCIWSLEVIEQFRAQGHPIAPGLAGENITLQGIDWANVTPGVRLRIGSVLCEISAPAIPCSQNKDWFLDGDFMLMHDDRGPVSRMYATVLEPGVVTVGDQAVLEPETQGTEPSTR